MGRTLSFEALGDPPRATWQASLKRLGRGRKVWIGIPDGSPAAKARITYREMLRPHVPDEPLDGPLEVCIIIRYPWLGKHTKADRAKHWLPCDKRPDGDNMAKIICDALTDLGFWHDDAQASDLRIVRGYGDKAGLTVLMREFY